MSTDLIARCTRNGTIQWSQVAKQLGVSVDRAQRMYAPTPRQDPQQIGDWAMPDQQAHKSPRAKSESHKRQIITLLDRHGSLSVDDLASRLRATPASIRKTMFELTQLKLCQSDNASDKCGRTWSLTQ